MIWQDEKSGSHQSELKSRFGNPIQAVTQKIPSSCSLSFKDGIFIIALIMVVMLVYQPAWHGGFLWDDNGHITRPELRTCYGLFRIWFDLGATQQYYPLLHSAFWLQYRLWGDATLGYHLVNISLHALSAVMVALILRRLAIPGAFLAAAIFALHPVHVESVAWITELKNTLSAVFYLGSAMVYLRFDQQRKTSQYLCASGLFVMGLLSKTVTATLPAALLLVFWWQRGRLSWKKDVVPLVPFFLIGAVAGIFTIWVERTQIIGAEGSALVIPVLDRMLIAGRAIWFYLGKLFWPAELIFIYPRWQIDPAAWWQYLFSAATVVLILVLWIMRSRWRGPLAGLLFFMGTLFPVLGFLNVFPFLYSFVADHFQYLASLGIITLVAAGIAMVLKRLPLKYRPIGYAVCALLLLTLATLTWRQTRMYTDIETLYRTTIRLSPKCWMAYNNLGIYMADNGRINEAIPYFQTAVRIKPDYAAAYNNMGVVLADNGQVQEAIPNFQKALRIKPGCAQFHNNLGVALARQGKLAEAMAQYQDALHIKPGYAECHNNFGEALIRIGKVDEAVAHFEKALQIDPDLAAARRSLDVIRSQSKKNIKALD